MRGGAKAIGERVGLPWVAGLLFAALVMLGFPFAQGAVASTIPQVNVTIGSGNVTRVVFAPGTTLTVATNMNFADMVVGDSKIADVVPLTPRSLYIQGKASGATNITIYDATKKVLGVIDVRVQIDFGDVASAIRSAVPSAQVRVTNVNDSIRLSGMVRNGPDLARVIEVAQQYSSKPVLNELRVGDAQQVMLEVRILEVKRTAGRDLGLGLTGIGGNTIASASGRTGITADSGTLKLTLNSGASALNGVPFGQAIAQVLEVAGVNVDLVINALEKKDLARTLAQPNLVALSGSTASFHAGGEVPIQKVVTASNGSTGTETDYRPYGVRLSFTPTVLDDGLINLDVRPEVSEIDPGVTVNGNPGFKSRTAETTVQLRDGQSFALAGLLQTVSAAQVQQLPWLGQVPVLGTLFRSTSFQKQESDLVIVVTPRLVRPASPDEQLASPLDKTRPGNDAEMFLLGMLEVNKDMIRGFKNGDGIIGPYGHIIDLNVGGTGVVSKK